jgi:hypothetical protein
LSAARKRSRSMPSTFRATRARRTTPAAARRGRLWLAPRRAGAARRASARSGARAGHFTWPRRGRGDLADDHVQRAPAQAHLVREHLGVDRQRAPGLVSQGKALAPVSSIDCLQPVQRATDSAHAASARRPHAHDWAREGAARCKGTRCLRVSEARAGCRRPKGSHGCVRCWVSKDLLDVQYRPVRWLCHWSAPAPERPREGAARLSRQPARRAAPRQGARRASPQPTDAASAIPAQSGPRGPAFLPTPPPARRRLTRRAGWSRWGPEVVSRAALERRWSLRASLGRIRPLD